MEQIGFILRYMVQMGKVNKMKQFHIQYGIGHAKYLVNFHDGIKTHPDRSEFFDIRIFKNKKLLKMFVNSLLSEGYKEQ